MNFESAPFKLTNEYVDLMDGQDSPKFEVFVGLLEEGIDLVKQNLPELLSVITIMMKDSTMPCFKTPKSLSSEIKCRINLKKDSKALAKYLVKNSIDNWRTT
jgi:phosphatidylinositol 4-kinase